MKKWILLCSVFLSAMTAHAYSEQALHEDALAMDSFTIEDEGDFDAEAFFSEGPLPLPEDPQDPTNPTDPNQPPPPNAPESFLIGTGEASRFGSRSYTFYPRSPKLISLRVLAGKTNIEVNHVWVTYGDTMQTVEISQLRGELSRSRAKQVRMSGRGIFRIEVQVSASSFWRQAGFFRMDGTSLR